MNKLYDRKPAEVLKDGSMGSLEEVGVSRRDSFTGYIMF